MIANELNGGVDIEQVREVIAVYQRNDFGELLKPFNNKATLVIGLSGTGKSTLCQLLAGNPDLKSESETNSYDYYITDGNNTISDSTITSKTYMPTLVSVANRAALLDCPGFLDTRSNLHEIATSVFIKNVMEHIRSVKILVVTSHHAVRKGVDRSAFVNLLNNLVGFVKSVQSYKNSIAIVVNKVEIQVNPSNMQLVPDEDVIKQAAAFLNEVRTELKTSEKTSPRVELLNIFLSQENEVYPKIGILRRPPQVGPLNDIKAMTMQKVKLEVLLKNLAYSTCDFADFGMPLSEGAKLCIFKTEETLSNEILERLTTICDTILDYHMGINDAHWSDCFPLLGPKRIMIKQINKLIKKIADHDDEDFKVTEILDWLHVYKFDLNKVEEELKDIFTDYDFLASVVDTNRDDHRKFFSQLASLRKALKKLMVSFKSKCCYSECCFRF
jgi:energy-coupling factor transporter ATP-binding protein EcfA2